MLAIEERETSGTDVDELCHYNCDKYEDVAYCGTDLTDALVVPEDDAHTCLMCVVCEDLWENSAPICPTCGGNEWQD